MPSRAAEHQVALLYRFFEVTEKELRSLERHALLATGAIFVWLTTEAKGTFAAGLVFVWGIPLLIAVLAAWRAWALGRRQALLLQALERHQRASDGTSAVHWASELLHRRSHTWLTAVVFYTTLIAFNSWVLVNRLTAH